MMKGVMRENLEVYEPAHYLGFRNNSTSADKAGRVPFTTILAIEHEIKDPGMVTCKVAASLKLGMIDKHYPRHMLEEIGVLIP